MSIGHAPNALIADYAAGALPPGMSLLVASHLTYCPACRDKVARLEALGGALLAEASAVAPRTALPERRRWRGSPRPRRRSRSARQADAALPRPRLPEAARGRSATCAGGRCCRGSRRAGSTASRPSGSG